MKRLRAIAAVLMFGATLGMCGLVLWAGEEVKPWSEMTTQERYAHQKARIEKLKGWRDEWRDRANALEGRVAALEHENEALGLMWYWGSWGYTPDQLAAWYVKWEEEHDKPILFEDLD